MSLVPYVIEQTARGERSYDIFSRLLNDRIIVLSEDVNSTSASVVVAQLLYLVGQCWRHLHESVRVTRPVKGVRIHRIPPESFPALKI